MPGLLFVLLRYKYYCNAYEGKHAALVAATFFAKRYSIIVESTKQLNGKISRIAKTERFNKINALYKLR